MFSQNARDFLVGQVTVYSVATQEKPSAISSVDGFDLGIDAAFNPEGAIDDVAAGKLGSLVSGNSPSPDLVIQIRMINGLAVEPPVFQTVDPTIADVGNSHSAPVEMDQSYCRRH